MKFVIETGNGSHTSSWGSMTAKFKGGRFDGQPIYQAKEYQVRADWDTSKRNEKWLTTEYEVPAGQMIEIAGKGADGPRWVNKYEFHKILMLHPDAEVVELKVDVGLRYCLVKGRLQEVSNVAAATAAANQIDRNGGF